MVLFSSSHFSLLNSVKSPLTLAGVEAVILWLFEVQCGLKLQAQLGLEFPLPHWRPDLESEGGSVEGTVCAVSPLSVQSLGSPLGWRQAFL